MYLHERDDFIDLLAGVAGARSVGQALVEKDYWVTHVLWALQARCGFRVAFKGGTSLSDLVRGLGRV
ncbi:MAG: hypothetical protein RQ745_10990 [Longimicrobiales bacterium]|nr:hypothetical protein [Longimicrobiales bacterium]